MLSSTGDDLLVVNDSSRPQRIWCNIQVNDGRISHQMPHVDVKDGSLPTVKPAVNTMLESTTECCALREAQALPQAGHELARKRRCCSSILCAP